MILRTNEGIGAWKEAVIELRKQTRKPKLRALKWNDYLALAAQDHCRDQGPRGITGHGGTDGSSPFSRIKRYGEWGGSAAENIAYG